MNLPTVFEFEGVTLTITDRAGRPWYEWADLVRALYGIKGGGHFCPLL